MAIHSPTSRIVARRGRVTGNPREGARDFVRDRRGAIAIEWALVVIFLVTALIGAVHFGDASVHKMQMANAVRAGMQYATVRKPVQEDTSGVVNAVIDAAPDDGLTETRELTVDMYCECPTGGQVACDTDCGGGEERRSYISIVLQEEYEPILKLPFMPNRMTLRTDETVRLN
jgi:Flp pilus assembly protein TadG